MLLSFLLSLYCEPKNEYFFVLSYGDQRATNYDIEKLKKLKDLLEFLQVIPASQSFETFIESHYTVLAYLRRMKKVAPDEFPELSEVQLKEYTRVFLYQLNLNESDLSSLLERFGVDEKTFNQYFGLKGRWQEEWSKKYRYIQPSTAEINQFIANLKKTNKGETLYFGDVILVHINKETVLRESKISRLLDAKNKDELANLANQYEFNLEIIPNPENNPIQSIQSSDIQNAAIKSCKDKKPYEATVQGHQMIVFVDNPNSFENPLPSEAEVVRFLSSSKFNSIIKKEEETLKKLLSVQWIRKK